MRTDLPVHTHRDEIVRAVADHQVVVIAGETGSGKTTQVPQYLLHAGWCRDGIIGVTEPRRIAATSVAAYVAREIGDEPGGVVGHQIRHDKTVGPRTRIKYMTEGILLRELLADPELARYDVLVLDEVHERNVNQDLIMALVRALCRRRPELRVVVMSATIDEERFAAFFAAPIVRVGGRMFPVDVRYLDHMPDDTVDAAVDGVVRMLNDTDGDVLTFVPDYASIRKLMEELEGCGLAENGIAVLPLYGNQAPEEQQAVFERTGRSVIVATNVAETSVTLDGVTAVVDTGLIKEMRYFPKTAISALKVVGHSRAGCDQRAGRAGRTAPGVCLRLFTERRYRRRPDFTTPEILRSNLDQVLLQLRALGFDDADIDALEFIEPPAATSWRDARETLIAIGALDEDGGLTPAGETMAGIPLPPVISRMVLAARTYRCVGAIATVAASFSTRPIFRRPPGKEAEADHAHRRFRDRRSDVLTLMNAISAWRNASDREAFSERHFLHQKALEEIELVAAEIRGILEEQGIPTDDRGRPDDIGKAVTAGLIGNLMTSDDGFAFSTRRKHGIRVFPGSSLHGRKDVRHAVCAEIVETTRVYARTVQEVRSAWLKELAPERFKKRKKDRNGKRKKPRYTRGRGRRR